MYFCSFYHQLRFLYHEPSVQESGSKSKNVSLILKQCPKTHGFQDLVFWFLDCMTHWVFKEPPLLRAPFTWAIKFPPGLRTTVSPSKRRRNEWLCTVWATLFRCEALLHLLLVLRGPDRDAKMPKTEHRKELSSPGQGCHTKAGQNEAEGRHSWRHNDSLIPFSPSSDQPLLL